MSTTSVSMKYSAPAAAYSANKFVKYTEAKKIKAKYTQTGTDATAGAADIYLFVVRIPAA